jgi:hypothetical protein
LIFLLTTQAGLILIRLPARGTHLRLSPEAKPGDAAGEKLEGLDSKKREGATKK